MRIILAHPGLDFDALASMVAAQKLYPDAVMVTLGKPFHNVQEFISLHKDTIEIKNYIDKEQITEMILVDTRNRNRLQEYAALLDKPGLTVVIYDHHAPGGHEIPGAKVFYAKTGANVTQLVERIRERDIEITPQEATVFALGIYEDTGSLSYPGTTSRDLAAAAYLLEKGASLPVVANFIDRPLSAEQQELLNQLMASVKIVNVKGKELLFAIASVPGYVGELGLLTSKLRDLHTAAAIFSIVRMDKRIYVVGRSNSAQISIPDALAKYGGGGHRQAASVAIKELSLNLWEIAEEITASVSESLEPPLLVGDIMSAPVKTVDANTTVNEVASLLLRYGHSGYPVMNEGRLAGIVSRQDVEKSRYHGYGHVPVKGYMSHNVVTVASDLPVEEARGIMLQKNIGRLPVVDDGKLVGIISRSDLLNLMYGKYKRYRTVYSRELYPGSDQNLLARMREQLPAETFRILGEIAAMADREGYAVYLVGGFVRDLLLKMPSIDLDIVVEGDGIAFAELLADHFNSRLVTYDRFGTANLEIENYLKLDIAGARMEFYEFPAAMPQVESSTIRQDMYRRDFTINAMAVSLNFRGIGRLVDYFNGRRDLEERKLRVLHNLSFVEDPTRILRALRFIVRYGFELEKNTDAFAKKAVEDGMFERLSFRRIWQEVVLALQEEDPFAILTLYHQYGIWGFIFPGKPFKPQWKEVFRHMNEETYFFLAGAQSIDMTLISFLVLVFDMAGSELDEFFAKVEWKRSYKEAAYLLEEIKVDFYEQAAALNDLDWYHFFTTTAPELVAVLTLMADDAAQTTILAAKERFQQIRIYSKRSQIASLDGYERPFYKPIIDDLVTEKYAGRLNSEEEEIAHMRANIEKGAYKHVR